MSNILIQNIILATLAAAFLLTDLIEKICERSKEKKARREEMASRLYGLEVEVHAIRKRILDTYRPDISNMAVYLVVEKELKELEEKIHTEVGKEE